MYAHALINIYIYISQHVDPSNINALYLGGGTRCSGRVSVPCFTSDTCQKAMKMSKSVKVKFRSKYTGCKRHRYTMSI